MWHDVLHVHVYAQNEILLPVPLNRVLRKRRKQYFEGRRGKRRPFYLKNTKNGVLES